MVALATVSFARFRTSTIEVDAGERRYSVETLEAMKHTNPAADLLFIIGTDMYQEIESWKHYRRLFELAHLVIVNRPGFPFREDAAPYQVLDKNQRMTQLNCSGQQKTVYYLPFVQQPISSTEIRQERQKGGQVSQWLPPNVWSYIERNKLYS
jgi:nicotinate-nucleotide adenylyltransferase